MAGRHPTLTAALCGFVLLGSGGPAATQGRSGEDRVAIADFNRRVQAYVELHRRIEGPVPTVAVSTDPGEVRQAIHKLGNAIRAERIDARQGDILTPEISILLRRAIRENCQSDFRTLMEVVHEDEPPMPAARVNQRWPSSRYPFMPPKLLLAFPPLPEELEYLFVNRDLVLWDWHADLIIDVLPNAIPRDTTE